jgi:hypothetical protein
MVARTHVLLALRWVGVDWALSGCVKAFTPAGQNTVSLVRCIWVCIIAPCGSTGRMARRQIVGRAPHACRK